MAQLLQELEWSAPLLPPVADPAWEVEIRRRGGQVFDLDRRVSPCHWLRVAAFDTVSYVPLEIPPQLYRIGVMVVSQESACRYCYGANRALLKVLGYSEEFVQKIEREAHLAELDDKQRAYITFCRNLARSRPRPSRAARDALMAQGYSRSAVHEAAFTVSISCFYNRLATLLACPPSLTLERIANGPLRVLMAGMMQLMNFLTRAKRARFAAPVLQAGQLAQGPFAPILQTLAGLPAASVMKNALEGAFAPSALSQPAKALMFAVVARTLACADCETSARGILEQQGATSDEIAAALANLQTPLLSEHENALLSWARGTVHYETAKIQRETRELGKLLGDAVLLEAIGVAALANGTVRMAMLLE